ncbi:BTAD domain-containing putative transcriptional regulator [Actinosynnema sp. NPDC020468]|uniref:AfsR/SARP family transcriptional regulator n=1 Tax=Actinosynnema sp. NPDC020468 TaxID=3154488 RepID=UPI0033DA38B6
MGVEIELLGEVRARVDGVVVDLGPARQRAVLAAMVVDVGRPVTVDQLVDRVWGERAPGTAVTTVRSYVSRLRSVLRGVGIVGRGGRYLVEVGPSSVDTERFAALLAEARRAGDDVAAARAYRGALELWRGEPFAGMESPWFAGRRHALVVARHTAVVDHLDIRLRRGAHAEVLAEVVDLAARHPRDERIAGQLMLALYHCGRQAEAMEHFDRTRRVLADELGADPGPELTRLHERILRAELPAPTPGGPRQLPARPTVFAGRQAELDVLTDVLGGRSTAVISAIGGVGGIGKTWLALRWAHDRLDAFPDGQLYANLRGFDPRTGPVAPEVVLRGFLEALGVEPEAVPVDVDAQASLYRTELARRRVLIVLDNASDTAQVVPLLPGAGPSRVLVTSRNRLAGLVSGHGGYPLALDVLSREEAEAVLLGHLGEARVRTEPAAVDAVLDYCAGLPLALGIVAARALVQSELSLAALADELRDEQARLDAVDAGEADVSLRAVLSWSLNALSADARALFAALGLVPGPDLALPAVASLLGVPAERVRPLLDELEHAHLVSRAEDRYRLHDLVKLYAAEQTAPEPEAALDRLVDHYLHTAYRAERVLFPLRRDIDLAPAAPGVTVVPLPDPAEAVAWFTAEHPALLAVREHAGDRAWRLAWSLTTFHVRKSRYRDRLAFWLTGLPSAERLVDDPRTVTLAHRSIADAYAHLGRHDDAMRSLHRALALAEASGDPVLHANVHYGIGAAFEERGDVESALEHSTKALHRYLAAPTFRTEIAQAHVAVGWHSALLGRNEQAREHSEHAVALCRELNALSSLACAIDTLALVATNTGDHARAVELCQEALEVFRASGDAAHEADVLLHLGEAQLASGEREAGRATLRQVRELLLEQGRHAEAERADKLL